MIGIKIDFPKSRNFSIVNTERAARKSAYFIRDVWKKYVLGKSIKGANFTVKSSTYQRSINVVKKGNLHYIVCAFGKVPMIIEDGFNSFDMKKGMLSESKAQIASDGSRFNVVPLMKRGVRFRKISDKSAENSWIHPGVKARPVFDFVVKNTSLIVEDIIKNGLEKDIDKYLKKIRGG